MATETASTSVAPVQPAFTDAERLALAGYLAGYRGLTREAYTFDLAPIHRLVPCTRSLPCSRCAAPTSRPSPANSKSAARARATVTQKAVHNRRVLQVRGRGGTPRSLARRACSPAPHGL